MYSLPFVSDAQINTYKDSIETFQVEYVMNHEVVKGDDRKFINFYPVNRAYRVTAEFVPIHNDSTGIIMKTTGSRDKKFYRYGTIYFKIKNKSCRLTVFKSDPLNTKPEYMNYLFLPFTDKTNGNGTYEGGRYIDLLISDISNNEVTIDFNKAYNPYCMYTSGYNCPIPPEENHLSISIYAGEKNYLKKKISEK